MFLTSSMSISPPFIGTCNQLHVMDSKVVFTVTSLQGGLSLGHVLLLQKKSLSSSRYWWERFSHLYSWVYWSNESKVSCSRKQQQQQLMELAIEPGTLRSPGQCSNHGAVLPLKPQCRKVSIHCLSTQKTCMAFTVFYCSQP